MLPDASDCVFVRPVPPDVLCSYQMGSLWCFKVQNLNLALHCTATICKTISQVLWLQDNIPEKVDQLQRHVSNWVQEKNATPNSPSLMFSFPLRCSRWATFCPVRIEFRWSQTWKTGFRFQKHHSSGWFKRGKKHQQTQLLIPWIKQRIKTHTHTCFRHFLDTRDVFFIFMIPVKNHCRWSPKTTNGSATTPWAAVLPGRRPSCRVCYWTWPMASSLIYRFQRWWFSSSQTVSLPEGISFYMFYDIRILRLPVNISSKFLNAVHRGRSCYKESRLPWFHWCPWIQNRNSQGAESTMNWEAVHLINDAEIESWTDWWFVTFFIFPYMGNNYPNWLSHFSEG